MKVGAMAPDRSFMGADRMGRMDRICPMGSADRMRLMRSGVGGNDGG